ncbi:hypothetical protein GQX74_013583 [Glossina fuscipes]|nr:hypothetical protein GQX74_013583 [Glossina fuscipes]
MRKYQSEYNKTIDYADNYATGNAVSYEDPTEDYGTTFYYKTDHSNEAIVQNIFDPEGDYIFLASNDNETDDSDGYEDFSKYVVSIRLNQTYHCVGCIIRADLVLTAAHCFHSKSGDMSQKLIGVDVVAGQRRRLWVTSSTQTRKAKRAILNDCWNGLYSYCDIALVELDKEFTLYDDLVWPLNLPKKQALPHTSCSTCGWGSFYINGPQVDEILCTDYLITPCGEDPGVICASPLNTMKNWTGLCDSGAPLICNDNIVGIAMNHDACLERYTDVYYYLSWINTNMAYKVTNNGLIYWLILICAFKLNHTLAQASRDINQAFGDEIHQRKKLLDIDSEK